MIPLTLRRIRWAYAPLVALDLLMLVSAVTEGGHYGVDVLAGIVLAVAAHAAAGGFRRATASARIGAGPQPQR